MGLSFAIRRADDPGRPREVIVARDVRRVNWHAQFDARAHES
jgi:hypothetical protein